ncbi:MAG: T9SS type A sorting domain-containing protein [bacterium]|nr:T9SS type A sorting domain-containing protein [bacterium]
MNVLAKVLRKHPLAILSTLSVLSILTAAGPVRAKTFVIPHVLESNGRISNIPFTFDTTIFADYVGGVACVGGGQQDVTLDLYLYDNNGLPMRGLDGTDVCNPCTATIGAGERKKSFNVENLFGSSGGMQGIKLGFAVIVVGGADPDNVAVQGFVTNSHTGPFDLSVFGFDPVEIRAPANVANGPADKSGVALPCGRVYTTGHLLATAGVAPGTPYTFDTSMFMTYTAGLAGQPSGGGATVDVYLFDEATGQPLGDAVGGLTCYPCTVNLDDANRKESFRIGALLPGGAVVSAAVSAVCVVSGDADNVSIQPFVVNTHTGPFDVSIHGTGMREITSSAISNVPADLADRLGLRNYPNPFNPRTTFAFTLPEAGAVTVSVFDADGARVRTLLAEGRSAGAHEVAWDGRADNGQQLPSGVYFGRIDSQGTSETQKVMLVK